MPSPIAPTFHDRIDLDILVERHNHETWRNSGTYPSVESKVESAIQRIFGPDRIRRNVRFIAP